MQASMLALLFSVNRLCLLLSAASVFKLSLSADFTLSGVARQGRGGELSDVLDERRVEAGITRRVIND